MNNPGHSASFDNDSELHTWAALVALSAVDEEDQPFVEDLKKTHPEFDELVSQYVMTAADLAEHVSEPAPTDLKSSIFAKLDDYEQTTMASVTPLHAKATPECSSQHPRFNSSRTMPQVFFGVAAAVVLVIAGTIAWQSEFWVTNNNDSSDSVADGPSEQSAPANPGNSPAPDGAEISTVDVAGGQITLERSLNENTGTVRLDNIPAPDPGNAYQMWIVGNDAPISAGVMERSDITPHMEAEVDGLQEARRFMISVEPTGGSESPSENAVATFTLAQG